MWGSVDATSSSVRPQLCPKTPQFLIFLSHRTSFLGKMTVNLSSYPDLHPVAFPYRSDSKLLLAENMSEHFPHHLAIYTCRCFPTCCLESFSKRGLGIFQAPGIPQIWHIISLERHQGKEMNTVMSRPGRRTSHSGWSLQFITLFFFSDFLMWSLFE